MAQVTRGIRSILSYPSVYSFFQCIMGGHKFRSSFVNNYIRPYPGMKVLDIGCGPADILAYLPSVDYWGFDVCDTYIKQATSRFGAEGKFYCQELTESDIDKMPEFEVVLALGLIHHLDDEIALRVMRLAIKALKPGGRLLTVDPCMDPGRNFISRLLVSSDRGKNVRNESEYASLASTVFESFRVEICQLSWFPYTHCLMECRRI